MIKVLIVLLFYVIYKKYKENKIIKLNIKDFKIFTLVPDDKNLCKKYENDFFKNNENTFCITKLANSVNKKNVLFIPGNNDYFYNSKFGEDLFNGGYNFYAISFPNYGFSSNVSNLYHSNFDSIPKLFSYLDLVIEHYKIDKIDILFGHSTGCLIATGYTNYKNKENIFIKRLVFSSPFFNWYYSKNWLIFFISFFGLFFPYLNIEYCHRKDNLTTLEEYEELEFNHKYKSLYIYKIYTMWIRACNLEICKLHNKEFNVKCHVDIIRSDSSVFWSYTKTQDNVLNVKDMDLYVSYITNDYKIYIIKNSIHNTFLRINNIIEFLNL